MASLLFEGKRRPLRGIYTTSPSQEISRKLLLASLLGNQESVVSGLIYNPGINQVIDFVQFLGAQTQWEGNNAVSIEAPRLGSVALPKGMLNCLPLYWFAFAVVLSKEGKAAVPFENFIDTHAALSKRIFTLFRELGVELTQEKGYLMGKLPSDWHEPRPVSVSLPYPYKEETEIVILLSVLRNGVETTVRNVSTDWTNSALISFLNKGGAKIERPDISSLTIHGIKELGPIEDNVGTDVNEAGLIAICTAVTGGEVEIHNVEKEGLLSLVTKFDQIGIGYRFDGNTMRIWSDAKAPRTGIDVRTGLYPRFSSRWLAPLSVLLTQCDGESKIIETVDSRGLAFLDMLQSSGAALSVYVPEDFDPQSDFAYDRQLDQTEQLPFAAKIFGPTKLTPPPSFKPENTAQSLVALLFGLMSEEPMTVDQVDVLLDEYPQLVNKIIELGAAIKPQT